MTDRIVAIYYMQIELSQGSSLVRCSWACLLNYVLELIPSCFHNYIHVRRLSSKLIFLLSVGVFGHADAYPKYPK